jgi:hypothetical protein
MGIELQSLISDRNREIEASARLKDPLKLVASLQPAIGVHRVAIPAKADVLYDVQ